MSGFARIRRPHRLQTTGVSRSVPGVNESVGAKSPERSRVPKSEAFAAFEDGVHRLAAFGDRSESTDQRPMLRLVNKAEARSFYLEPLDTPCLKVRANISVPR
ncbi:unnamed protein product [Ixodes pacificus]